MSNINQRLETIATLIDSKIGHPITGGDESKLENLISTAEKLNDKPIRVLKDWKRFELCLSEEDEQLCREQEPELSKDGIHLVYSHNVISDSTFMVPAGGWVRSTFLIALHNQCIFETPNTNYILIGNGREVKISLEEYYLLLNLR
ncbi:DUF6957 family protein [Pseudoalteromonas phenolica]|uniref:DUF6957 family protein n=1 Tax=Pseudoalteromonas phenolica TaxID=161398 RepID=UPI00110AF61B|nr:hypothetical protein [Pseudoalteromonas phenolica]TMO57111.1 hypothetical protein CWC21_04290 [Pseudoalteromonas phenolica]